MIKPTQYQLLTNILCQWPCRQVSHCCHKYYAVWCSKM